MSYEENKAIGQPSMKEDFMQLFKQDETALQEQISHLSISTLSEAERSSTVERCQAGISRLSNELRDASSHLPAYDQRTYSTAVKTLNEKLQEARTASAPKRKFAFKKTASPKISGNSAATCSVQGSRDRVTASSLKEPRRGGVDPNVDQTNVNTAPLPVAAAVTISSLSSTFHKIELASFQLNSSASLNNIHHSAIDISKSIDKPFANLTINSVTESLLLCGRVNGAAHITGVENSTLTIWSRQVRMHESKNCFVFLRCTSRPIIEDCSAITFAPMPSVYDVEAPPHPGYPNLWDQVDDFNWLRAEHSPNWTTLQPHEERVIDSESWKEIRAFDATQLDLDDYLRMAKVI